MANEHTTTPNGCPPLPPIADRPVLSLEQAADLEAIFKVLASATRLRILHALVREPALSVGALAEVIGMTPQAVSNQLRRLVDRGILAQRRDGNHIRYRVDDACTVALLDRGFCLAVCAKTTVASVTSASNDATACDCQPGGS